MDGGGHGRTNGQSLLDMAGPIIEMTRQAGWASPQHHIVCQSTLATRDEGLIERAQAEDRQWHSATGHDLLNTEPQFVSDALRQIAWLGEAKPSPKPEARGLEILPERHGGDRCDD